uniref:Photosystem I assembly protein Ycf36 n=1 Tax=Chondria sp. (in: red algae) TaxID=1982705 RepID=A0A1Z1MQG4_9FLOR|nr:hypothetical protein [Chondria sp. (in: red algae)]
MSISKNNCPIPFDQQPINEYLSLKKSYFFSLSLKNIKIFILGFLLIFTCIFIFISFILLPFYYKLSIIKMLILDTIISDIVLLLIFIRLYLGWSYVVKRLVSATVFYEESGWYDGQIWVKPSNYLIHDRLIGFYQVMPFIVRIKYAFFFLILVFALFSFFFLIFE